MESLRRLFERLKTISLWDRLFRWGAMKSLLIDAMGDFQRILPTLENLREAKTRTETQLEVERNELKNFRETLQQVRLEAAKLKARRGGGTRALMAATRLNPEVGLPGQSSSTQSTFGTPT